MPHVGVRIWPLLLYVVCHTLRRAPTQIRNVRESVCFYTHRLLFAVSLAIHVRISTCDNSPHLVCGGTGLIAFDFAASQERKPSYRI